MAFQGLPDFRTSIHSCFFAQRLGVTKTNVVFDWSSPRGSSVRFRSPVLASTVTHVFIDRYHAEWAPLDERVQRFVHQLLQVSIFRTTLS